MTIQLTMPSPVGELLLTANADGLTGVWFEEHRHPRPPADDRRRAEDDDGRASRALAEAAAQLEAYFAGKLTAFDLPLAARGTPFQERVWGALRGIGFGEVISYAELARRIGDPRAVRAVGAANGRNPLSIIVPCHRVIGADGSLTGYGGGITRKRWLLEHEGALRAPEEVLALPL
ncbi:MAG TPA: methylated-DNA--[protein]-cysteine S-methyltransferase [Gemmatimonadaceae bacterium]|nr:methylated-DNA--[protein]-cysteine S-methyltransferase [Gemmatimonadaceae bacterium]